jgi:hypothetical protein
MIRSPHDRYASSRALYYIVECPDKFFELEMMLCEIPVALEGRQRCSESDNVCQSSCVIPNEVVAEIMKLNECHNNKNSENHSEPRVL